MGVALSLAVMAGHCVIGKLLANKEWQNGALSTEVVDKGGEKDCCARCRWCNIGSAVSGDQDGEDDTFLAKELIHYVELKSNVVSVTISAKSNFKVIRLVVESGCIGAARTMLKVG